MFSKNRGDLSLLFGVCLLLGLLALAPRAAFGQVEKTKGKWTPEKKPFLQFPNVPIHTHVLPTGKVLFWGRRAWKDGKPVDNSAKGLNEHDSSPFLWDADAKEGEQFTALPKPGFNMFCSSHTFLADGRLLVIGGHLFDQKGVRKATIFDPGKKKWTATADMNAGRWYPTAVTLADGSVLAIFGTDELAQPNTLQQIWKDDKWIDNAKFDDVRYYPRMHVVPDGRVFMTGPLNLTQFLDTTKAQWAALGNRSPGQGANVLMEYAPSVLYDEGKILYIGGGQAPPSNAVKMIDLNQPKPLWQDAKKNMAFPRRQHNGTMLPDGSQHNGTMLPDGSVLVTGGTMGSGGPNNGFNDLTPGHPVHTPELWDPSTGIWTKMADEGVDRCYHSTAVLLPDGRVLSGGGGEYFPTPNTPNPLKDSHADAQIFWPPYLFQGARPDITAAPDQVTYKTTFEVGTSNPGDVGQVNWIRLSSVTHSFNTNQRINFLKFTSDGKKLTVTAPDSKAVCPPGHYMLFVLNKAKVPSIAKIINIQ
jgi:hypothetical protein